MRKVVSRICTGRPADLVVLASGMVSSLADRRIDAPLGLDRDHFVVEADTAEGIFAAGCARGPFDVATSVQDATAAAARAIEAIQTAARSGREWAR